MSRRRWGSSTKPHSPMSSSILPITLAGVRAVRRCIERGGNAVRRRPQCAAPGVAIVEGNDVAVRRLVALMEETDVLVTVDLRRYDRWLVDAARTAASAGVWTVSIADSVLSPVAACAQRTLVVTAAGAGPFDSHVGTLALMNVLIAGAAVRLRGVATERLDRAEAAWRASNALSER